MSNDGTIDQKRRGAEYRQMRETLDLVTNQLVEANHERANQHSKIKDLQADVEACHRTIAAGTRELEDAQSTVVRLTGEVEKLNTELGLLRNLLETAQNRARESQEAWQLEQRLDTMRDVFRDTVHVLIEKL